MHGTRTRGRGGPPRRGVSTVGRQSARSPQQSHQRPSIPGTFRRYIPLCAFGLPSLDATGHKWPSNFISAGRSREEGTAWVGARSRPPPVPPSSTAFKPHVASLPDGLEFGPTATLGLP